MKNLILSLALVFPLVLPAQEILRAGAGSYAAYAPWEKSRTFDAKGRPARGGDECRKMQNRELWVVERKGRPLPTNDWWTDLMLERYSGNLWAYPALVRTSAVGVTVKFPSYWIQDGTEMKSRSSVTVGGAGFTPESAVATDWHDWDFSFAMRDPSSGGAFRTTLAHGMPYVWIETTNVTAKVTAEAEGGAPAEVLSRGPDGEVWKVGGDLYGITRGSDFVVVSLIPTVDAAPAILRHATAVPRATRVDWRYDAAAGCVRTTWRVTTEDLRTHAKNPAALQGFLPHHFRGTGVKFDFPKGLAYATPRGELRLAEGNALEIDYPFAGMVPYWPMPEEGKSTAFRPEVLDALVRDYAAKGRYGGDTYWGGKGLLQMAFAMLAARERGDAATYAAAHASLRAALEDWFTWKPGEKNRYFAYVPRWGGLVGEDTSYGSDAFNDHHFHYGYFTYSGALLCLVDADFREKFGPMLRLLARDYANPRRDDPEYPFFRTFDPWAGHSFAGGIGDGAGNGQESSSEAMQGWGGEFWLGVALGDDELRDAALFGYVSEARGTAEYWFDRTRKNIDYSKYKHPYCSNLTCHGVGWWTYFSGDPVWMHSIQWMPSTPVLDYLSEDKAFAKWDYETMWAAKHITGWDGELGKASLGNILLSYWQRSDPEAAGAKFDELWDAGKGVAHNPDTAHMTYWQIQAHLACGDIDNAVYADAPWARAYKGTVEGKVFVAYNPMAEAKTVTFYERATGAKVGSLVAAPRALTVSGRKSAACPVFGTPAPSPVTDPRGLTIVAPRAVLKEGVATPLRVEEWSTDKKEAVPSQKGSVPIVWSSFGGKIDEDGNFTPTRAGSVPVTAKIGERTIERVFLVEEALVATRLAVSPKAAEAAVGDKTRLELKAIDQFGGKMSLKGVKISIERMEDTGKTVVRKGDVARLEKGGFVATEKGDYRVTFTLGNLSAAAKVAVRDLKDLNLARLATVTASGEENPGLVAANATDGDPTTRWGSAHRDGEWICLDLKKSRTVSRAEIQWENARAEQYRIEVSDDGAKWRTVADVAHAKNGRELVTWPATAARYVRLTGLTRNTPYGISIFEFALH